MSGVFPVGIVHLPFVEWLGFSSNNLSGPLPRNIFTGMKHLVQVHLGDNQLSGEVPMEWWQQSRFNLLDLSFNELTGNIPPEITEMKSVQILYLEGNKFTGTIPTEMGELKSLESLYLSRNRLYGPIPSELGKLERLSDLSSCAQYLDWHFTSRTR